MQDADDAACNLSFLQPFQVVNIPRAQIAAMLGGRTQLQYAPDQNSASPIYGTTDDHDGESRVKMKCMTLLSCGLFLMRMPARSIYLLRPHLPLVFALHVLCEHVSNTYDSLLTIPQRLSSR
jgi:hypothetical protein